MNHSHNNNFSGSSPGMVAMTGSGDSALLPRHCHRSGGEPERAASRVARRQLAVACLLCFLFVVGELLGGYYSGRQCVCVLPNHLNTIGMHRIPVLILPDIRPI
jgi:hypothetical protein